MGAGLRRRQEWFDGRLLPKCDLCRRAGQPAPLQVGVDVGYVDAAGDPPSAMELLVGTRAGGFVGYKRTWRPGFTAEVQLGPVHVWGPGGRTELQTLHTVRLGWSF